MSMWQRFPKTASRPGPSPEPPQVQHETVRERPFMPDWTAQKGVHDPEFDPCGDPRMRLLGRDEDGDAA